MKLCSIEGCEQPHYGRGWCKTHYGRWFRHGDPLAIVRPTYLASNGYRRTPGRGGRGGSRPYEHRVVLLGKIGGGWHTCHWCRTPVSWDLRYPHSMRALVVDHLDCNKLNNDPENLVPSCNPCNMKRAALAREFCPNGHHYTDENTVIKKGYRRCRTCMRENDARYKAKRRARAA